MSIKQTIKTSKNRLTIIMIVGSLFIGSALPLINSNQTVDALSGSQFNPGRIIDDSVFFNSSTMSATQIQNFLNSKVPTCDTNHAESSSPNDSGPPYTCLKDYRQNTTSIAPESGICGGYTGANNESAATIIYKVAKSCGINPQVLLVMLQKEQSLVTDVWPWDIQYEKAMGAFCPDTAPCDPQYKGFFYQVYYGAHRFKIYKANPDSFNYKAGRNNTIYYHPGPCKTFNSAGNCTLFYGRYGNRADITYCGGKTIYIQNVATALLYIYTPYQPNAAALNNLYDTGDGCSSYGNRNFWRLFTDWFGSTTRSVLFKVGSSNTYYLEWGDLYYPISSGDILDAYGLTSVAPRVLGSFPAGKTRGPLLERAAKFGSDNPADDDYTALVEIVDSGKRHAVPNWGTLSNHGYSNWTAYDPTLSFLLYKGDALRPVVRRPNGVTYLIENNKRRGFKDHETYATLSGPNYNGTTQVYAEQSYTRLSDTYIFSKTEGAPMLLDGKTIKAIDSPAIYLYEGGEKFLFSVTSYVAWGGKTDYAFTSTAIDQIQSGGHAPIFIKSGSGSKYLADSGKKKPFNTSALLAWDLADGQFSEVSTRSLNRLGSGSGITNLVTDHRPGIYYIEDGIKHGIPSLTDFARLGFSWSNISQVSKDALITIPRGADLYAPGALIRKPNGAVYIIDDNYTARAVRSSALFSRYGLNWNNVKNVTAKGLDGYTSEILHTLLKDSSTGKYYVVEGGVYRHIDVAAMGASQYSFLSLPFNEVHPAFFGTLKSGKQLTRFLRGSGPTVYYIENGQKRPFTSEASFYAKGGTWAQVIYVSDVFLDEIPRGAKL